MGRSVPCCSYGQMEEDLMKALCDITAVALSLSEKNDKYEEATNTNKAKQ